MTIVLLVIMCPFCEEGPLANYQSVRRHVARRHKIILPSRDKKDQVYNAYRFNEQNAQKYPDHVKKYPCPCCSEIFADKNDLEQHVNIHKL